MSNVAARGQLARVQRIFTEKPAAARTQNTTATATWRERLSCEVSGPSNEHVITDMPEVMGGNGTGPNPGWLLRASIASCAATAIAMHAALQGVALKTLEVKVDSETDARGLVGIPGISTALSNLRMSIKIGADGLDESQLRELAAWGDAISPVSCTLRDRPHITTDVTLV